jgi:hypothetical protein
LAIAATAPKLPSLQLLVPNAPVPVRVWVGVLLVGSA